MLAAQLDGVRCRITRFDFDGFARFEVILLDEPEKCRILIRDSGHPEGRSQRTCKKALQPVGVNRALGSRDGVSVRVVRRAAQHFVYPLDQPLRHDVLELFGVLMHLVPAHAHDLHEEELDEAVAAQDQAGELLARAGQADTAVRFIFGKPRFGQRLHHGRRRAWRHAKRSCDVAHRHEPHAGSERHLSLIDRFEIILDGTGREHAGDIIHRMSLRSGLATPDAKRRYVRRLFATIADRYDLITRVLSFGLDRTWKRRLVELARPVPGAAALDLATGTGDIAFLLHDRAVRTVGLDVTRRMIELARAKCSDSRAPSFVVGDMMSLPFPVASFDVVTTGYGLRNVPDLTTAIDEMYRVLKDGGQALSLDFNRPGPLAVRAAYLAYLNVVGSVLGWILHRDPDTYRYIPASISRYPGAVAVAKLMEARGFRMVSHHPVLGGLMAIHHALK